MAYKVCVRSRRNLCARPYPSWIHRIPELLEILALVPEQRIDRRRIEELFQLGRSASHQLLQRLGAERCGSSLVLSRGQLMARLREAQEHPDWRWERERRQRIRQHIDQLRPAHRRSLVPVTSELREQIEAVAIAGLPESIRFEPGRLTITCRDLEHLVEQLVLVADTDYETFETAHRPTRAPATGIGFEENFRSGGAGVLIASAPWPHWR